MLKKEKAISTSKSQKQPGCGCERINGLSLKRLPGRGRGPQPFLAQAGVVSRETQNGNSPGFSTCTAATEDHQGRNDLTLP